MNTPVKVRVPLCLYCGQPIVTKRVVCTRCETPHHPECFAEYGRCTIFACGNNTCFDPETGLRRTYALPRGKRPGALKQAKQKADEKVRAEEALAEEVALALLCVLLVT